jgi:hypothetical protein
MERFVCLACGTQFPDSPAPPAACRICDDPRQYVPPEGQRWTTLAELSAGHHNEVREDGAYTGVGTTPWFAIGQRALLVPFGDSNLLWDCISLLDEPTAEEIERRGGLAAIAISHPHYYASMVDWAEHFDVPILLHADDAEHVMRPSPRIEHWTGERHALWGGLELVRLGGHFPGGTVCLWPDGADGAGALLAGDVVQVCQDRDWASFMWSFPNYIPLPAHEVQRIRGVVESLDFDRLYGAWWWAVIDDDAQQKVLRSADRYLAALAR